MNTQTNNTRCRRAEEVLDILDRWSERMQGHQTQKREFLRRSFRTRMTLYLPSSESLAGECQESTSVDVWCRNLSQGGLCFLYPKQLNATKVIVCLNPEQGGTQWFNGEIIRNRQVHNDFWEYGIQFAGRAEM